LLIKQHSNDQIVTMLVQSDPKLDRAFYLQGDDRQIYALKLLNQYHGIVPLLWPKGHEIEPDRDVTKQQGFQNFIATKAQPSTLRGPMGY
jgi:hypothetical protein